MTTLDFEKLNGLIPAIMQDASTNRVFMLGFMNREALEKTKKTGFATFYSRTRRQIWTKGETSGNYLKVIDIKPDCDGDTLLVKVSPQGPVCHTGTDTCFDEANTINIQFLEQLEQLIKERKNVSPSESYTAKLLADGPKRIAKKLGEEAVELALEAENGTKDRILDEASDLMYHLIVLLTAKEFSLTDVAERLKERHTQGKASKAEVDDFQRGEKQWGK